VTTTIAIQEKTRDLLKQMGKKGETYDDIIQKAIEVARKEFFFERQDKILKSEEFVPLEEI